MTTSADHPGVIAFPPFLYGGAFAAALVLRLPFPLPISHGIGLLWPGLALVVLGFGIAIWGRRKMEAAGTSTDPSLPATAIVTGGPFRYTRNPLYLAITLIHVGLSLAFNTWWGLIALVPVLFVMHGGVVLREERYLEQKFGEPYRQYRAKVRRYL